MKRALFLLVVGCGYRVDVETVIRQGVTDDAQRFIVECAKAANPMSDEEGEDLVAQCERTALKLYGTEQLVACDYQGFDCVPCESATGGRRAACRKEGFQ